MFKPYTAKNATDLLQVVNFTGLLQFLKKFINNKLLVAIFKKAYRNFLFPDLGQFVETTCSKPVDNKFGNQLAISLLTI